MQRARLLLLCLFWKRFNVRLWPKERVLLCFPRPSCLAATCNCIQLGVSLWAAVFYTSRFRHELTAGVTTAAAVRGLTISRMPQKV